MALRAARAAALAAAFSLAGVVATPAIGSVRYSFLTEAGSFTAVAPDFITLPTEMAPAELESCAPMATCPGSRFIPDDRRDDIEFSPGAAPEIYRFDHQAFNTPGRHDTQRGSTRAILIVTLIDDEDGLSVSQLASRARQRQQQEAERRAPTLLMPVPEPATWMTMLAGFGLLGGALRRARRRDARGLETRPD